MRRGQRQRLTQVQWGVLALVLTLLVVWFGFTKAIPFQHHFAIEAVFETSNNIRPNSPVRIAGVDVGKVEEVRALGDGRAVVRMRIEERGRPIHRDARFAIRPRIFLEGNFFVDVQPGSPSAPRLGDGDRVPAASASTPVQLDQILTALQSDARRDLQTLLREYGAGVSGAGGRGFNASIPYWRPAYRDSALVNQALQGTQPHDLSGYVEHAGTVAEALDEDPEALKALIADFDTTAAAFARHHASLEATVAELPRTLRTGAPALRSLNRAFPPLRRLVADLRPAVRSSVPALRAGRPLVRELRGLVSRRELRGLAADLRPTVPALARLNLATVPLLHEVRAASSCQNEVIQPWSTDEVVDPNFPTRMGEGTVQLKVYEEAPRFLPGIAGESRTGDANGQWFRVAPGNGTNTYNLTGLPAGAGGLFGNSTFPILGANPGKFDRPALRPNVPCETQEPPNLASTPDPPPARVATRPPSPAARALQEKGKAYLIARLRQQQRRHAVVRPSAQARRRLRSTDLRLEELRAEIVDQLRGSRGRRP